MPLSQKVKELITTAWADGYPCLVGTMGQNGPNVSPKSSLIIFDDDHLAYLERSKRQALENLQYDPRVVVVYSNMKAQWDGVLEMGVLRFYGRAALHERGSVRDAIFAKLSKCEQEHAGADVGIGVLIRIERTLDALGRPFM
jgi:hypothetical protein